MPAPNLFRMPHVSIVGLGPSDAALLTIGALERLKSVPVVYTCNAAPATLSYLRDAGVDAKAVPFDASALLRGVDSAVVAAVELLGAGDAALGVPGHPLLDVPGLPHLLRALATARIEVTIVPGVPRAALSAAAMSPLVALPPVAIHHTWEELVEIMARLRVCCPWDREQTHATLLPYLVEEAHEVVEAVDEGDAEKLRDELGDLLLQIVFHAQIACEQGRFTVADVIDALANKMIRRHPHVFGDASISTTQEQMKSWELIKTQEAGIRHRESLLDGIPKTMPSLLQSQRMQEKAGTVGFDWPQAHDVLVKLDEELEELRRAITIRDAESMRDELGDLLFTIVNVARRYGVDAEAALRQANVKFRRRFATMERIAGGGATALANRSLDDLDALWQRAKEHEAGQVS
ncbi:MAG: nucleoside triphosphate pyrophosphohydrolase [Candidatus Eremiobacteraeota bacterium]|nr:nucleoside triphosphate pyrophosphohydrolase [Candidatus Eremiobacteraeota bacterium]MBV8667620.1 nucleoside triphosphate pyrophosphohydrolase [Candidatus Eremiobacteraeota bacterium]